MAVTITTLQGQDGVGKSRLVINANFSALKAAIDASQLLLNPTTSILSGVKSATINDAALPLSNVIFTVGKGSSLLGNVIMGTTASATTVIVNGNGGFTIDSSNLNLTNGNFSVNGTNSVISATGHVSTGKESRMPGISTEFAGVGITVSATVAIADKKYLVLKNESTTTGLTAGLPSGTPGQVLEISHVVGASGFPIWVDAINFNGLTGSINMTMTGDALKCVYEGSSWYLLNHSAASFATGGTTSSITFTVV